MKKEYINPEMEIIKLNARYQLMAGSEVLSLDDSSANEIDNANQFLSREDEFFDE